MCFTTGYIEVSMSLPGSPTAPGLWPGKLIRNKIAFHTDYQSGAWTLGNLVCLTNLYFMHAYRCGRVEPATAHQLKACGPTPTTHATWEPFLVNKRKMANLQQRPQGAKAEVH
jgi:hypothetical protein